MDFPGIVCDLEADGLNPSKIYVLSATNSTSTEPSAATSYEDMRKIKNCDIIVCHNCIRFDRPVMERILEIEFSKDTLFVDTLALSWYLYPNRPKHGLAEWGEELGIPKPEIDDWENLSLEEYVHRCKEDVRINALLWEKQWKYLLKLYGTWDAAMAFLRYLQFKMNCAALAEKSGWKLDREKCEASIQNLEKLQQEKIDELGRVLPKVPIVAKVSRPKVYFKRNGELSQSALRWEQLLESRGLSGSDVQEIEVVRGYDEPNPNSHQQVKDWLFSLGWEPDVFKTNDKGVEVPQINKLKQDGGGPSESIKRLGESHPEILPVIGLGILQHRLGILRGFIRDVDNDGYLRARVSGLTNTLRFKHAELVNLPKIDAPYGIDIRGCLSAPDGYELCGSDMSSLEDRTKQHYMWKYDPDYVREMMTPDFDPHLDIAVIAKLMTKVDADWYKKFSSAIASHDEHVRYKLLKTIRGIAKNTNYACVYGAGAPKIAKTAGISVAEATPIHAAYWRRNWSVKAVANDTKTKTVNDQEWLYNPVSRFWYTLRNKKDKFSTLNQGTGVFCFDTWLGFILSKRQEITGQFHDEGVWTVRKGFRNEMTEIIKWAIDKTNEVLGLNRQLDCEIQWGTNYAEIH
jgi:DNA polymerase III epsilon subunit-like protein